MSRAIVRRREAARKLAPGVIGRALAKPDATSRLCVAMWPDGVPADQVALLPRAVGMLEGVARWVQGGDVSAPLLDVASDAFAGHMDSQEQSEFERPIPYSVAREDRLTSHRRGDA